MGADPIAMCGNCREVKGMFPATDCISCINECFATNINEKEGRVVTKANLEQATGWEPYCPTACERIERLIACAKEGHRVLIDPCW